MAHTPMMQATKANKMARDALSEQERAYCDARLHGAVPVQAARMAGISVDRVTELENSPVAVEYMRSAHRIAHYDKQLTRNDVLNGLMDATHMAANATELVAAWREIGKVIGAYEPERKEISITDRRQIQELSDDDLAQLAAIEGEYQVIDFEEGGQDD